MVVGWLVGVCEAVGEVLAVGVGLEVAWLVGVGDGWPGVADGVAIADVVGVGEGVTVGVGAGWLFAAAAISTGSWDEAVAATVIPATMATMPAMTPAVISRRGHGEEARVSGTGPLPVNGCLSGGLDWHGRHVLAPGPGRHLPGKNIRVCPDMAAGRQGAGIATPAVPVQLIRPAGRARPPSRLTGGSSPR